MIWTFDGTLGQGRTCALHLGSVSTHWLSYELRRRVRRRCRLYERRHDREQGDVCTIDAVLRKSGCSCRRLENMKPTTREVEAGG